MFGPSQPRNEYFANVLVDPGPKSYSRKNALKALATCEAQLTALSSREPIALLAHDCSPTQVSARIIAVTALGIAVVSRTKVEKHFSFSEVAETQIMQHPRGMIVIVETRKAQDDFLPDDWRRHEHVMQFFTATPGAANRVCAAIDQHLK